MPLKSIMRGLLMDSRSPLETYQAKVKSGELKEDPDQLNALVHLNRIYLECQTRASTRSHGFFKKHKPKPIKGLYMYGGVGRGKTLLMDLFFYALPIEKKMRMHFYRFMAMVHERLNEHHNESDPLKLVAKEIAKKAKIICFDEFIVEDIADAMILGLLFKYLFNEDVVLIATSNVKPNDLYEGGIQRDRFMPAIELINQNLDILNVDAGTDYRVQKELITSRYFTPLKDERQYMQTQFDTLAHTAEKYQAQFELKGRKIKAINRTEKVVWFEFNEICRAPRGPDDYIALAKQYEVVLVSNIPQMYEALDDMARRFVALIDELYDNDILLICSAQVPIMDLYSGSQLAFIFERTKSRLIEMQRS